MEFILEIIKQKDQGLLNLLNLICLVDCISAFLLPHGLIAFFKSNGIILAILISYIIIYYLLNILSVFFRYFFQILGVKCISYVKDNKSENKKIIDNSSSGDSIIFISIIAMLGELVIPSNTILFYINQNFTGISIAGYSFTVNFIIEIFIFILICSYFSDFLDQLFNRL